MRVDTKRVWTPILTVLLAASGAVAQGLTPSQKSKIRNAKYYLETAEGNLRQIGSYDAARRAQVLENVERVLARAGKALQGMPSGNPKVAEFLKRYETAKTKFSASKKTEDTATGGALLKDLARLREISKTLGQSTSVSSYPDRFVLFGKRWDEIAQSVEDLGQKHAEARKQRSGPGWEFQRLHEDLTRHMKQIERAARNFCEQQPQQLATRLTTMEKFVERAVKNKNHRVFDSYVARESREQTKSLAILDAWGYDTTAPREKLAATSKRMRTLEAGLADVIVRQNRLPSDFYRGPDRAEIEKKVRALWKKTHPKDEILAIRFPDSSWNRDRRIRYSSTGGFWREDKSEMQVRVVIAFDEKTALNCGVTLVKDHEKGGKTRMHVRQKVTTPSFRLLRSKT